MSVADSELITKHFCEGQPPFLSVRRISEVLGIGRSELATPVGVSERALAKSNARELDPALRPLVSILSTAIEITGEGSRAAIWFKHQPIPGWAGKTAYDLVGEGRAATVADYLAAAQSGVYA